MRAASLANRLGTSIVIKPSYFLLKIGLDNHAHQSHTNRVNRYELVADSLRMPRSASPLVRLSDPRRAIGRVLDENIDCLDMLLRAKADLAMDVVNLKISKLGGLTKISQVRDLCVSMGIAMTLEDSWGGDITTAAIAHLAQSTPEEFRFTSTDFNSYVTVSNATGAPQRENGFMKASVLPGLGIEPRFDVLGPKVVEVT